jgi:hypothetical protein
MTRLCICIMVGAAALLAADSPARKSAPAASARPAQKTAPANLTLPAGAVEAGVATWHYTAADGSKWIYRKTPFGLVRFEDKPAATTQTAAREKQVESIKAVEDGDSVRFERPGPFGVYKWSRKKADLDEQERQAWERSRLEAPPAGQKQGIGER